MAFQITDIQKKFHQSYSQHKEHLAEKKQVSDSNPKGWVALFFFHQSEVYFSSFVKSFSNDPFMQQHMN